MRISEKKREEFDAILEQVIGKLPERVREMLPEIPIVVEDEPSEEIQRDLDAFVAGEPSDLCGLHWGVPLTERSVQDQGLSPVILIFRGPIFRLAEGSKRELREQVQITLLHELGHHFGFSEEELDRMGYG